MIAQVMFLKSSTAVLKTCNIPMAAVELVARKVDVRQPEKENLKSHSARPIHIIMIKWSWTSRLSIKNSLSIGEHGALLDWVSGKGSVSPLRNFATSCLIR